MPGIRTRFGKKERSMPSFSEGQEQLFELESQAKRLCCSVKAYPGYPVRHFRLGAFRFILEGCIYNLSQSAIEDFLVKNIAEQWQPGMLKEWIRECDGEFILQGFSEESYFLVNDALGRLPLYKYEDEKWLLLSRELDFIEEHTGLFSFDRIGLAEQLWLGYPMGERTIFKNIDRVGGGTLMTIESGHIAIQSPFIFNFEEKKDTGSIEKTAGLLAEAFKMCNENIASSCPADMVLSLSGGQDSRAVASALSSWKIIFSAASFFLENGFSTRDAAMAGKIAEVLKLPFELYEPEQNEELEKEMISLKYGLNNTGVSFLLDYLAKIKARHPAGSFLLTGDGGDKVLPDMRDFGRIRNIRQLQKKIIDRHGLVKAEKVEALLDLPPGTLMSELRKRLESYPEADLRQKGVHFVIYERAMKQFFEGEDRNRAFLWSTSPFYSLSFFMQAMQAPDHFKTGYKLYSLFQHKLSDKVAVLPDIDGHVAGSFSFYLKKYFVQLKRSSSKALRLRVRHLMGKDQGMRPDLTKILWLPENGGFKTKEKAENYLQDLYPEAADQFFTMMDLMKYKHISA